ncbi:hypothetical protein [Streptomyces griseosporeus]
MGFADTSIAAVSAALSGVAALASWRASREANRTADSVAQIERDRWHGDLTPQLRVFLSRDHLHVRFEGPASLGRLRLRFVVRDDRDRSRDVELAGGPTAEIVGCGRMCWAPRRAPSFASAPDVHGDLDSDSTHEPGGGDRDRCFMLPVRAVMAVKARVRTVARAAVNRCERGAR